MGKSATLACWGVVVVTWIAGALYGARNAHPRHQGSSASLWALGSVVGAIVVVQFAWNDVRRLTDHSRWLELPGLVLLVVSTVFAIWARLSLGRMWSASPNVLQDHHELRTDGPYAITRHPIYTGLLGMLLGTALLNGLGVSLAILFVGAGLSREAEGRRRRLGTRCRRSRPARRRESRRGRVRPQRGTRR
jgi:protein-S-isoprenylcysteine O-methyltransferase Ste14